MDLKNCSNSSLILTTPVVDGLCSRNRPLFKKVKAFAKWLVPEEEGGVKRAIMFDSICQTAFANITKYFFSRNVTTTMIQHL